MSGALADWQQKLLDQALRARQAGRLPHALLIAGPAALGKRALAFRLACSLLCQNPQETAACGECHSCQLMRAGTHPDFLQEGLEENDKGVLRSEILIAQIRRLNEQMTRTPQIAAARVALIQPADAMNRNAFNALLKTLEEPVPGRYLILIADRPHRLPATIRSRCQVLRLEIPSSQAALDWLRTQRPEVDGAALEAALEMARGNPGLALQNLQTGGLESLQQTARDLVLLSSGRAQALEVARRWQDGDAAQHLRQAAELVHDHLAARAGAVRSDHLLEAGLARAVAPLALADWFDASLASAVLLEKPLRQELQLASLLNSWQELFRSQTGL